MSRLEYDPGEYGESMQATLGIPVERMIELTDWLHNTVLPSCRAKSDVIDLINAGRGIEGLTSTEKLVLAFTYGWISALGPMAAMAAKSEFTGGRRP